MLHFVLFSLVKKGVMSARQQNEIKYFLNIFNKELNLLNI